MQSNATSVAAYLAGLPEDRRRAISAVREVIRRNIDPLFQETMQYGMIGYSVPHALYPHGYHCDPKQPVPFAGLASQKNHMALYLMGVYGSAEMSAWFQKAWTGAGKKLDMGASCVRFKKLEDVPLDVVGELFRKLPLRAFLAGYVATLVSIGRAPKAAALDGAPRATKGAAKKKTTTKKKPAVKKKAGTTARAGTARKKKKTPSKG